MPHEPTRQAVCLALLCLLTSAATISAAMTVFVDVDRPSGGDGLTWTTAFADLQDGLDAARNGQGITQIWVAEGTYLPDRGTYNRNSSFELVTGVELYGGFAGGEQMLGERDPTAHPTVLLGDLLSNDQPNFVLDSDNSRHVVTGTDLTGVVVDGFEIRGGNAEFDGDLLVGGGGMFITSSDQSGDVHSLAISNCIIRECSAGRTFVELGNFGGGLLLRGASATITGCRFEDNRANSGGALGLFDRNAAGVDVDMTVLVTSCEFAHNVVPTQTGGAMYSAIGHAVTSDEIGTLTVQDCRFEGNTAGYWGAWADFNATFLDVTDCEFIGNSSDVSGGAAGHIQTGGPDEDPARFTRCLFRGNHSDGGGGGLWISAADAAVTDCVFQGNTTAGSGAGLITTTYFTAHGAQDLAAINCVFDGNVGSDGAALASADNPLLRLVNCTFADNTATGGPSGGVAMAGTVVDVDNTIFWGNSGTSGDGEPAQIRHVDGAPISVDWSLVQGLTGGFGGQGNIDADPFFLDELGADSTPGTGDEDLRPSPGSRCIDAGNNLAVPSYLTFDQNGEPRFVDDPNTPDTGQGDPPLVDVGALEFQAEATGVAGSDPVAATPGGEAVPNPAAGTCEIRFRAAVGAVGPVTIYDLEGARVRKLPAPDPLAPGAASVVWDGLDASGRRVPAGLYLARAGAAAGVATVRILRVR